MKIGITLGDPSGIGPEVTLKALEELGHSELYTIIGARPIIEETGNRYNIKWDGEVINCLAHVIASSSTVIASPDGYRDKTISMRGIKREDIGYGKVSELSGRASYEFILKGYALVASGDIDALVTAPICKASVNLVHPSFYGHTELLADLSGTRRFAMMLMGDEIRVTLVTTHIPIKEVAQNLNEQDIVAKIELTHEFLVQRLGIKSPKIGVCALNPHGSEGVFGDEESRIIAPAIEKAKNKEIDVKGPYPADTLFVSRAGGSCPNTTHDSRTTKFDAIIAMYHDQGMIPLKLKEFGGAVNVTLGLPFIRTSPDHGTAFDIAGKGVANPDSMIKAIKLAKALSKKL